MTLHNKLERLMNLCEQYDCHIYNIGTKYFHIRENVERAFYNYDPNLAQPCTYIFKINRKLEEENLTKLERTITEIQKKYKLYSDIPEEQTYDYQAEQSMRRQN